MSKTNTFFVLSIFLVLIFALVFYFITLNNKPKDKIETPIKEKPVAEIIDNSDKYYALRPDNLNEKKLAFKLLGTVASEALILSNIEMSDQYPGVIESGTITNTGKYDLLISRLSANGMNKEKKDIYYGHFETSEIVINDLGIFEPQLSLKKNESKNVSFVFDKENGNITNYPADKSPIDTVFLNGIATEIKETVQ